MVSPKAKGIFREDHPLFLGTIEGLGTAYLYDYIDTCDLVLTVGFDPVEFDRDWSAKARVVHIGVTANDDRYYGSEVEVVGPIDAALEKLWAATDAIRKVSRDELNAFRDAFASRVGGGVKGLSAQGVLAELRAALPEDALVSCDVGYNKAVSAQCWRAYRPRTFFVSNGLSSMGYGLPAALALKLADRTRPVACVLGDGGFAMAMAEIETGTRLGLGGTVVAVADIKTEHRRLLDLVVVTLVALAVTLQHVELVRHLRRRKQVAGIRIFGDEAKSLLLAHATDHDRRMRPREALGRAQRALEREPFALETRL